MQAHAPRNIRPCGNHVTIGKRDHIGKKRLTMYPSRVFPRAEGEAETLEGCTKKNFVRVRYSHLLDDASVNQASAKANCFMIGTKCGVDPSLCANIRERVAIAIR